MGQISSFVIKRWKLLLNIVTILALLILVYATRKDLVSTFSNLGKVNAWALLLLIPVEFLNYHAQAKLYQSLFKIVGHKLSYRFMFLASLELNFVNQVFPSGGAAGLSYFGLRMKTDKIGGGKAVMIQVMKLAMTYLSFEVLVIVSVFALASVGRVNGLTILVAGMLTTILIIATILFIYIVGNQNRINAFFEFVTRQINRTVRLLKIHKHEAIDIKRMRRVFEDFHSSYRQLRDSRGQLKAPFLYALLANITEVAAVYVVFIAFGRFVNVGAVILAYGIANFAGTISVLPGGVGIYETLMTAILLTTGIPPTISLPVVIMYRVVNTILQLPPGYYLYQKRLSDSPTLSSGDVA